MYSVIGQMVVSALRTKEGGQETRVGEVVLQHARREIWCCGKGVKAGRDVWARG